MNEPRLDDSARRRDPRLDNEARYDRLAPRYDRVLGLASLGLIRRLYRAVAAAVDVGPDAHVVEVGSGPGSLTPYLRRALGDGVRITGIDLSGAMVALAQQRAASRGWTNVSYVRADAATWSPDAPVDALVFSLVLSGLPHPLRCLSRSLEWLVPRGRVVVLDSFLQPGRPVSNFVVRAKAPAVGAVPEELPLAAVKRRLDNPKTRRLLFGSYTLVTGRRPD